MRNLVLLPVVLLHLVLEQFHARAHESFVVSSEVLKPPFAHVNNVRAHTIQEVLRVRYQHQDAFIADKQKKHNDILINIIIICLAVNSYCRTRMCDTFEDATDHQTSHSRIAKL